MMSRPRHAILFTPHAARLCAALLMAACALPALAAPPARSHGNGSWRGNWHGSAPPRVYYYPRGYYRNFIPLPPPPLFYDPPAAYYPPNYYIDPGPITYLEANPPPVNYITNPQAATPKLPLEDRLKRLKSMCDQGLFTPDECATRRQQILNEM